MTTYTKFKEYIWLVNTIYDAGEITLSEINEKWLQTEMSEGVPLSRTTFFRHKCAIEDIFGIYIDCDRKNGNKYYIGNKEVLREDSVQNWMLSTLSVSNMLEESQSLQHRILLENIPSGDDKLQLVINAMKENRQVMMTYRRYGSPASNSFTLSPYCIKLFHQRWYLLGRKEDGALLTFALDRIVMLELTKKKFKFDESLNASDYFEDCYGVMRDETKPAERIVLRAYGTEANYLRDLKLHHSQKEIATADEYSDFELFLRPSMDFRGKIMERGERLEVMEPEHLATEIEAAHLQSVKLYENRKDILKV